MKKSLLWIIAASFSLVLGQSAAYAWSCGDGMKKMVDNMKLDDAQKAKIMPIMEQLKPTLKASWSQMSDLRAQIQQQIQSDNMDQATLDGLMDKKAKLIGDMMKAKATAKHQIYMILNPQQRAAYQAMVKKWTDKMVAKAENCDKHKNVDQDQDQDD